MGFLLFFLLSSAVFEPDDCPNKNPGKAFSFYGACKATIQYCIVPAEVVALCKIGMLFSGHMSDALILLVGRMLRLSAFASLQPKYPSPQTPLLRAGRVGYPDPALITNKWCQHISNAGAGPQFINCLMWQEGGTAGNLWMVMLFGARRSSLLGRVQPIVNSHNSVHFQYFCIC